MREPLFSSTEGTAVPFSQLPREDLEYIADPSNPVDPSPSDDDPSGDVDFARRYAAYLLNRTPGR